MEIAISRDPAVRHRRPEDTTLARQMVMSSDHCFRFFLLSFQRFAPLCPNCPSSRIRLQKVSSYPRCIPPRSSCYSSMDKCSPDAAEVYLEPGKKSETIAEATSTSQATELSKGAETAPGN